MSCYEKSDSDVIMLQFADSSHRTTITSRDMQISIAHRSSQTNYDPRLNSLQLSRQANEVVWRFDFCHPRCGSFVSRTPFGGGMSIHECIIINILGAKIIRREAIHLPAGKSIKHYQQTTEIGTRLPCKRTLWPGNPFLPSRAGSQQNQLWTCIPTAKIYRILTRCENLSAP